jgi:hypothetical protein
MDLKHLFGISVYYTIFNKQNNNIMLPAKNSNAYKAIQEALKGGKIRTAYYRGTGRRTTLVDFTGQTAFYLRELGIDFVKGNDAPRGGGIGNYIYIFINY